MSNQPAERPTPDVKPMGAVTICRNGYVEDLERQLAEAREQRDLLAALVGTIRQWFDIPLRNVSDITPAEHSHEIGNAVEALKQQRDQLAAQFTKLDKPKYSGAPMMDKVLAVRNPEFDAWVQNLPPTYWTRYDLSAARIGWEAAKGGQS